jgi:plastocyanin
MRTIVLLVAVVMTAVCFFAPPASAAVPRPLPDAGPGPAVPILYIQIIGEAAGTKYVFTPEVIIIPQVPITLNVTFFNNQTAGDGIDHTFTINNNQGSPVIDTGLVAPQANVSFEFTINTMTNITYNGTSFQPGPPPSGTDNGTIQYYCIPHVGLGMKGTILLGTALPAAAAPEKGVFLRA